MSDLRVLLQNKKEKVSGQKGANNGAFVLRRKCSLESPKAAFAQEDPRLPPLAAQKPLVPTPPREPRVPWENWGVQQEKGKKGGGGQGVLRKPSPRLARVASAPECEVPVSKSEPPAGHTGETATFEEHIAKKAAGKRGWRGLGEKIFSSLARLEGDVDACIEWIDNIGVGLPDSKADEKPEGGKKKPVTVVSDRRTKEEREERREPLPTSVALKESAKWKWDTFALSEGGGESPIAGSDTLLSTLISVFAITEAPRAAATERRAKTKTTFPPIASIQEEVPDRRGSFSVPAGVPKVVETFALSLSSNSESSERSLGTSSVSNGSPLPPPASASSGQSVSTVLLTALTGGRGVQSDKGRSEKEETGKDNEEEACERGEEGAQGGLLENMRVRSPPLRFGDGAQAAGVGEAEYNPDASYSLSLPKVFTATFSKTKMQRGGLELGKQIGKGQRGMVHSLKLLKSTGGLGREYPLVFKVVRVGQKRTPDSALDASIEAFRREVELQALAATVGVPKSGGDDRGEMHFIAPAVHAAWVCDKRRSPNGFTGAPVVCFAVMDRLSGIYGDIWPYSDPAGFGGGNGAGKKGKGKEPKLAPVRVQKACVGALEALLDAGVIHGDAHLDNFGFDQEGRIQVLDFGNAKRVDSFADPATWTEAKKMKTLKDGLDRDILMHYPPHLLGMTPKDSQDGSWDYFSSLSEGIGVRLRKKADVVKAAAFAGGGGVPEEAELLEYVWAMHKEVAGSPVLSQDL
uniref:Protein kinase domain-containing protein n=1 Tax=Chromera velia CCMP2878 TaxID=1169474 RepID=A0A0G4HS34_9ALVE|eukprot:Cvel_30791.t1-p1 / transcript=Cvel_30791.t1 / gene=Cvel_30791 / organism=Chromera_velia_CCMP2878 / gene_product=hypothetical protein / transcript_product=hypothetical protein / location=Cvel_scaffold4457:3936-7155(-) / protein_length=746 / sequence_SO=supercontig / SO=protein_coding / is_pseudo=false